MGRYSKIIQFVNQTAKSAIKHSFKTIHLSFFINFSSKKKLHLNGYVYLFSPHGYSKIVIVFLTPSFSTQIKK